MKRIAKPGNAALVSRACGPLAVVGIAAFCVLAEPAQAQNDKMTPIANSGAARRDPAKHGPLKGGTATESWHHQYGKRVRPQRYRRHADAIPAGPRQRRPVRQ